MRAQKKPIVILPKKKIKVTLPPPKAKTESLSTGFLNDDEAATIQLMATKLGVTCTDQMCKTGSVDEISEALVEAASNAGKTQQEIAQAMS